MDKRLNEFLKAEDITAGRLANALQVQPSAISHILSGRNKPGFDFLAKMLASFPELNPRWLILGIGNMYLDTNVNSSAGSVSDAYAGTNEIPSMNIVDNIHKAFEPTCMQDDGDIERIIIFYKNGKARAYDLL